MSYNNKGGIKMSTAVAFERLRKLKEENGVGIKEISEATKISKYTLKKYFSIIF
jgi:response regulator of citrate/malate metabolism